MKVIGYVRVSTKDQGISGLGLESQEKKIRQYCELYDLELTEVVRDTASGKNLKRPGLREVISRMENGEAEGIVIAKLDRLTRSVKDMGTLLEGIFQEKTLCCVAEQIDTNTASGRMVLNILISVSQWERETVKERTVDALNAKKDRKEKLGGEYAPFGKKLKADGVTLETDEKEAEVIALMKDLKQDGFSYQKIADALTAKGYLTKTGLKWQWHSVRKIYLRELKNEKEREGYKGNACFSPALQCA